MRIATSDPTGLYYNSNDHLTSASVITNVSGGVVQKLDYLPFGSERVNVKTSGFDTRFTFTDQEKDDESGLMYYGARYYNPVIGRFTSVDPAFGNFMEPQSFNKYAYTQNNPLKYIDPTGLSNLPAYDSAGHPMATEIVIDTYQTGDLYYDTLNKNYNIIKNNVRLPLLDDQKTIGNVIPEKKINWSRFEKVTSNSNE